MYISWEACNYIISATILDFWLPVSSGSVTVSTIERFDPENIEIDTRIMFLSLVLGMTLNCIHIFIVTGSFL